MNIGVYGGSFNPPHLGHLLLARSAMDELELDKVLFVPAYQSPFKEAEQTLAVEMRCEMVELAISESGEFRSEFHEALKSEISYTVDTLDSLRRQLPGDKLFLLMGADTFRDFHLWKQPERIVEMATPAGGQRPGFEVELSDFAFGDRAVMFGMPLIEISSSDIRQRVREGRSIQYLVPWTIKTFIEAHGLYR